MTLRTLLGSPRLRANQSCITLSFGTRPPLTFRHQLLPRGEKCRFDLLTLGLRSPDNFLLSEALVCEFGLEISSGSLSFGDGAFRPFPRLNLCPQRLSQGIKPVRAAALLLAFGSLNEAHRYLTVLDKTAPGRLRAFFLGGSCRL
jgi:hypothetical protein